MASELSIRRTIAESYSFACRAALPSLPRLLMFAVGMVAFEWMPIFVVGSEVENTLFWLLGGLVALGTGVLYSIRLYYLALLPGARRSLAWDGWRLLLANLAVYALFFFILVLLAVFLSVMAGILIGASGYDPETLGDPSEILQSIAALSSSGGGIVLYALLLIVLMALIWLALRLVLYGVATVAREEVTIFSSWAWTRGHAPRLFVISLVAILIPYLFAQIFTAGLSEAFGLPSVFRLERSMAPAVSNMSGALLISFIGVFLMAPFYLIGHGMAVSVYRQIAPQTVDVDATFG